MRGFQRTPELDCCKVNSKYNDKEAISAIKNISKQENVLYGLFALSLFLSLCACVRVCGVCVCVYVRACVCVRGKVITLTMVDNHTQAYTNVQKHTE